MKVVSSAVPPSSPTRRFSESALALFDRIDSDGDSYISSAESTEALLDRSYTRQDAATVATLVRGRTRSGALGRLSNDEVGPERSGVSREDLRALPGSDLDPFFSEKFSLAEKAVESFQSELFAGEKLEAGVSQGSLGDCWLLAAAVSLARQQPTDLTQSIGPLADGGYQVKLPQGREIRVEAPTVAEAAAFASSGTSGQWLTVLEKAVGQSLGGLFQDRLPQIGLTPRSVSAGIKALTGDPTDHDIFLLTGVDATREKLSRHLEQGDVVVAGTGPDILPGVLGPGIESQGLVPGHCYAVLEYDATEDRVLLQNPYGDTEWNGSSDGTDDGVFWMGLGEMHHLFTDIAYQQSAVTD